MKRAVLLSLTLSSILMAENLASTTQVGPLKSFSPPKPIAPNIAQGYMVENQFDRPNRQDYFSTSSLVYRNLDKFHISSGVYGKSFYNSALFKYRGGNFYTNLNINHTKANSYKDGGGNRVWFGYERFNQAVVLGYLPNEFLEHRLVFIHDNIDDDKQPHNPADAIKTERYITKFKTRVGEQDLSNTVLFDLSHIHLKRESNNFSLRKAAKNKVFVDVGRDIYEFLLSYERDLDSFHNSFGGSFAYDDHIAKRYLKTPNRDVLNGYRFPDVVQKTYKIYNSTSYEPSQNHKFSLGFEYIHNDAKAKKFDAMIPNPRVSDTFFPSPKALWRQTYGVDFDGSIKQNLFNVKFKYDFRPLNLESYSVELARISRLPSNPERFSALFAPAMPQNSKISNPHLEPEIHNFIKFSFDVKSKFYKSYLDSLNRVGLNFGGYVMADKVKDLIIFDRARGQSGVVAKNGGIVTRNVDATIYSTNLYTKLNFTPNFATSLNLTYKYGQNDDDKRALYQIRPFEALLNLDYMDYTTFGSYNIGSAIRYVAKQNRGDFDKKTGLGIDSKNSDFTTLDLYAGVNVKDKFGLRLGVNNLFDREYAEFITGEHVEALDSATINAPGRVFYMSFHASF